MNRLPPCALVLCHAAVLAMFAAGLLTACTRASPGASREQMLVEAAVGAMKPRGFEVSKVALISSGPFPSDAAYSWCSATRKNDKPPSPPPKPLSALDSRIEAIFEVSADGKLAAQSPRGGLKAKNGAMFVQVVGQKGSSTLLAAQVEHQGGALVEVTSGEGGKPASVIVCHEWEF